MSIGGRTLATTVWTSGIKHAMRMTKAIRAATVGISGYQLEAHAAQSTGI